MLIGYSIKLLAVLVLFAYMWSVNRKRDRESAGSVRRDEEEKEAVEAGMHDVTEIDNKGFRYIL
jgi:ribose 1,5-bisphosphokinase PhnN